MVTVSAESLRTSSEICLAETTISPGSVILASIVQEIAIFKSIPWITKRPLQVIKCKQEKIGVLGLDVIAFCAV